MADQQESLTVVARMRDELSGPIRKVRGDAKDATVALENMASPTVNTNVGRLSSSLRNLGTSIRSNVINAAKIGGTVLTGLATAAGIAGIKASAAAEQNTMAFETMLGSAEKAMEFQTQLEKFAKETPFDLPGLTDASKKMFAFGFSAEQVQPTLTAIGDAVAGVGGGTESINGIITALGQMRMKGKVSAEEMMQLSERNINGWGYLAKSMGKSTAEVQKMSEKGLIPAEKAIDAIIEGLGNDQRFKGLMAKQSVTMAGLWATLQDTTQQGLRKVVDPWKPAITQGLQSVLNAAGPFFDWWARKSAELAQNAPEWIEKLRGFLDTLPQRLDQAEASAKRFVASFQEGGKNAEGLASLKQSLSDLGPAFQAAGSEGDTFGNALAVAAIPINFLADHVDTLVTLMPYLAMGFLAYKVAQLAANVAAVIGVGTKVADVIATRQLTAAMAGLTAANIAGTVATGTNSVATGANTVANTANTTSKRAGLMTMIAQRTAIIASAIASGILTAGLWLWSAAQWALNAAMLANPIGLVILAIVAIIAIIVALYFKVDWVRAAIDWLWQALQTAWDWILKVGKAFAEWGIEQVQKRWETLKEKAIDPIVDAIKQVWEWGQKAVDMVGSVIDKAQGIPGIGAIIPGGDTATSRMSRVTSTGRHVNYGGVGRFQVTSGYRPYGGSGDHRRGAVDITGSHLGALANRIREGGGFAEKHGTGRARHLHAIPAGDTASSRMSRIGSGSGGGGDIIVDGPLVQIDHVDSEVDVERAVRMAVAKIERERKERK